jgi:antirestriction protein ArdC
MDKKLNWGALFESTVKEPGKLGEYYSYFHRYSLGNQAWVTQQMKWRGIPMGPVSTFNGWKKVGRRVKKGEKGLSMLMPLLIQKEREDGETETIRVFVERKFWFALAQTEPDPSFRGQVQVQVQEIPEWDKDKALKKLGIKEIEFNLLDGNIQGFALPSKMELAVSPIAAEPLKTLFHEIAHCLLHARDRMVDGQTVELSIEEAEAEAVAMLCCATLRLPGLEESRGYIQSWLSSSEEREKFLKKSAVRVFAAADKILKAGYDFEEGEEAEIEARSA